VKSLGPYCISLIAILAFTASPALAQWELGGKPLIPSGSNNFWSACSDSAGGAIVAWDSYFDGSWEIFAQRVDSAGIFLWGDYGILITDVTDFQIEPLVIADGAGGAFIGWVDNRDQHQGGTSLYAQHVDSEGNRLWQENGIKLISPNSHNRLEDLIQDGQLGFMAVCTDDRFGNISVDLYAQRLSSQGAILWDSSGVALCVAERNQSHTKLKRDNLNYYYAIWSDMRNVDLYMSDIYAQKFDVNGNIFWSDSGAPVVIAEDTQGLDGAFDIACDNEGGIVVDWFDWRYVHPYDGVRANRLSATGESMWDIQGVEVFAVHVYMDWYPKIFNFGGHYVVPHGIPYTEETRGFKLGPWGTHVWPIEGIPLLPDISVRNIIHAGEGVFFGNRYGRIAKFDTVGNAYWPDYPLITHHAPKMQLVEDMTGGVICTWREDYSVLKIQRVYSDGRVGGDTLTSVLEDDIQQPKDITLFQNYPNPFNSSTIVGFRLNENCDVFMEIFDLLGRKILHNDVGDLNAGDHNYAVNMDAFPSGIYFLRLTTGASLSGSIKMVLSK
jgi:hypothetical protein